MIIGHGAPRLSASAGNRSIRRGLPWGQSAAWGFFSGSARLLLSMTEPGRRWMWRHCVEIAVWIPAIPRAWAWHDSVAALAADIEAGTQAVLADAIAYLDVDANSMRVI